VVASLSLQKTTALNISRLCFRVEVWHRDKHFPAQGLKVGERRGQNAHQMREMEHCHGGQLDLLLKVASRLTSGSLPGLIPHGSTIAPAISKTRDAIGEIARLVQVARSAG
jgi:hypothetical protein